MLEQRLRQGQPLGHYRLIRLLGQGGFAEVYLAEHIHLNTQVAVKVLHTKLVDEDVLAFKREAQTVARLVHPNIVRVLDFGVEDAIPYLVMDYAPNGTLRHIFPKGQRVPLSAVVSFTKQMAEALHYAHGQRLIHRDIKPENMLLGSNQEALLSDFGIALVLQSQHSHSTQNIAGTIAYMAPEQIQAHPVPASDQYSLGIVVYEWLCGTRPFQGSYTEIAVKQSVMPPPPLRTYAPDIPPAVEMVVMQALQKDPRQRFADVRTFALALEQAVQQVGMQQDLSTVMRPQSAPFLPSLTSNTPPTFMPAPHTAPTTSPFTPQPYTTHTPPLQQVQPPYPYPPYNNQPVFDPSLPNREQKGFYLSRRALLIGGAVGVVAVGGIAADVIFTQLAHPAQSPSNPFTQVISNIQQPGGQPTAELTYTRHSGQVLIVRWSPDGKYIASGSMDGTMQVWTADQGETKLSVRSTVQPVQSDDYPWSIIWSSRKNQKLAVSFVDGTIQVLDANSGQRLSSLTTPVSPVVKLAWSPDERYLAAGGSDNIVRVYQYPEWKLVTTYQEHTNSIKALAWSPDGQTLASGSEDTTVRLWEPLSGRTKLIYKGHSDSIGSLSWSADSTRIVSTAQDQTARVWQVSNDTTLYTYNAPGGAPIGEASWSHDNNTIAIYGGDATIYLLDAQTGHVKKSYFTGVDFSLSWSPDDTHIVTGSYDKVAKIWRMG
ncbi:MAG TPA: serine/threonine-protein kinase [Ktedonobacteraceae bacterium]|nr:serine/threonine-protein kinase [Ktedonobacteraceae bacterium]